MMRLWVGAVFGLTLWGCNPVTVGVPCETRDDCVPGQECHTAPGGYCTRGCTQLGATLDCPAGTICQFFGNSQLVCATYCDTNADCRVNFECVEVGGTTARKACRPEGAK